MHAISACHGKSPPDVHSLGDAIHLHRNELFLDRVRPQIALLREVGANGVERGLHHGGVKPGGRVPMLRFFQYSNSRRGTGPNNHRAISVAFS